jgi:hypothetical protein
MTVSEPIRRGRRGKSSLTANGVVENRDTKKCLGQFRTRSHHRGAGPAAAHDVEANGSA